MSSLPAVLSYAIRMPIITTKSLADGLKLSQQASTLLVRRMLDMGFLLEATRRDSWGAFVAK
jgi:DNA-binding MarR family transcriptional regulator